MSKKKIGIIVSVIIVMVLCSVAFVYRDKVAQILIHTKDSEERVYVEKIASMNGQSMWTSSRFNGVVETQDII